MTDPAEDEISKVLIKVGDAVGDLRHWNSCAYPKERP